MILVSADGAVLDPSRPLLFADEAAALRGDGVFETLLVRDGHPGNLRRHLDRLADGAGVLELPLPPPSLPAAVATAAQVFAETQPGVEGMLRIVYARGRDGVPDGPPTCYVMVTPVPPRVAEVRAGGVAVITLDRGRRPETAAAAPWQLAGIKALAYAENTAALRHAARLGAGDAIFVDQDGVVLEGPRASVVVERDGVLLTPPRAGGILPGTTQEAVFELASQDQIPCCEQRLTVGDLWSAEAVWLVSSVTLAARVTAIDGRPATGAPSVPVPAYAERTALI